MHRSTGATTLHRSHTSGGARHLVDEVDDKSLMQTSKGTFFKGQSREGVEAPQNYGFTSVVMPADKGADGQIEGSAEGFASYMGGNQSFPVIGVMDDRRHRLKELEHGDSAMFRTKDDRQQFHLSKDGNFMTARNDRVQRFALVDPPKKETQQQQGQQQQADAGGGGTSGSGGGTQKPKATGQKHALDDNKKSQIAIEQNGKENFSQHGSAYTSNRGGSDQTSYYGDRTKSTQVTDDHSHLRTGDMRIYTDAGGCWASVPILVKKDPYCKE